MTRSLLPICAALVVVGCKTVDADNWQPARIVEPTDASRAALQLAVNDALGTDVLLADDALVNSSLLTIERDLPGKLGSPPAQGRIMDRPIRFQLLTDGEACVLVDKRDDSYHRLNDTSCEPE